MPRPPTRALWPSYYKHENLHSEIHTFRQGCDYVSAASGLRGGGGGGGLLSSWLNKNKMDGKGNNFHIPAPKKKGMEKDRSSQDAAR